MREQKQDKKTEGGGKQEVVSSENFSFTVNPKFVSVLTCQPLTIFITEAQLPIFKRMMNSFVYFSFFIFYSVSSKLES